MLIDIKSENLATTLLNYRRRILSNSTFEFMNSILTNNSISYTQNLSQGFLYRATRRNHGFERMIVSVKPEFVESFING